jgi:hypothetical protein
MKGQHTVLLMYCSTSSNCQYTQAQDIAGANLHEYVHDRRLHEGLHHVLGALQEAHVQVQHEHVHLHNNHF